MHLPRERVICKPQPSWTTERNIWTALGTDSNQFLPHHKNLNCTWLSHNTTNIAQQTADKTTMMVFVSALLVFIHLHSTHPNMERLDRRCKLAHEQMLLRWLLFQTSGSFISEWSCSKDKQLSKRHISGEKCCKLKTQVGHNWQRREEAVTFCFFNGCRGYGELENYFWSATTPADTAIPGVKTARSQVKGRNNWLFNAPQLC